jgi:hypothetical protein
MGTSLKLCFVLLPAIVACKFGDDLHPTVDGSSTTPHPDSGSGGNQGPMDAPPDGPPTEPGLILHYAFEDSTTVVTDGTSRGKDGTLSSVAGWTADGRIGRALAMVGTNPATIYVDLPDGILTGVTDFTISFWVKLNTVAAWARIYDFGNGQPDPANRFMYFTVNGFIGATNGVMASSYGGSTVNENALTSQTQLPTGVWKHVAVVGVSGTRTIYIDGFPAVSVTNGPVVAPQEMEPIAGNSWLGKSRFGDPGLDGTIDELKIYNRALTQTEIADQAWPKLDYSYWRFDENTGATTRDSSDHNIPTAMGTGVTWAAGRLGSAVDFPGGAAAATGPTITLASNPLASCTTELTVSAWVKQHAVQPWARVFDFGSATTAFIYLAPSDGAGMHFAMVAPTGVFDLISPTVPFAGDDTWHHVAVTVAADHMVTMYADGAVIASAASPNVTPADFASLTDLWLGKSRFTDPYLNGSIDELRVGCRALTGDEIKNLAHP